MLKKAILGIIALALWSTLSSAQGKSSLNFTPLIELHIAIVSSAFDMSESLTFYQDKESKIYFIDLEAIPVNLSGIKVYDKNHQVVFEDKLWDLPVDSIYELSVKNFKPGVYSVELASYINTLQKEITVEN